MTEISKSCPALKLYYFDIPGKGEAIRLAAHYGKLPLEDIRVQSDTFAEMKAEGKLAFGQFPCLELNGVYLVQSASILRYVGRYAGLYPTDDFIQAALIDSLLDEEIDLFTGVGVIRYRNRMGFSGMTEEVLRDARGQMNDVILPKHLQFLENFLRKSPSGWLAGGSKPSIADFCFVPRLEWLVEPGVHEGIDVNILEGFPLIKQLIHQFNNLPEVVDYYQQHPKKK